MSIFKKGWFRKILSFLLMVVKEEVDK